jgi:hypothetical protein
MLYSRGLDDKSAASDGCVTLTRILTLTLTLPLTLAAWPRGQERPPWAGASPSAVRRPPTFLEWPFSLSAVRCPLSAGSLALLTLTLCSPSPSAHPHPLLTLTLCSSSPGDRWIVPLFLRSDINDIFTSMGGDPRAKESRVQAEAVRSYLLSEFDLEVDIETAFALGATPRLTQR